MAKDKHIPDPKVVAIFEAMIADISNIELKGDQNPYLSMNGNMYASMSKLDRIGIRLNPSDLAEFLATYEAGLHEAFSGFFQKEYAAVPESLYGDVGALRIWFAKCHAHALTLKIKPTAKPKK